mgnify:CR=1 FL=1
MVTRNTRITIEGYPRSANTYAVYAFKHVNAIKWNEIAHHLHVQAQIIRSIKYKIPVILSRSMKHLKTIADFIMICTH